MQSFTAVAERPFESLARPGDEAVERRRDVEHQTCHRDQTFNGVIVTSGLSGTRVVVASVVVARGVFNDVGRVVEIENLRGDPDNVTRDDLVFADGSIHVVSPTVDASFTVNPRSCLFSGTLQ